MLGMDIPPLITFVRDSLKRIPKSQADLARELDVSESWLNKFLNENPACSNPTSRRLQRLVDYCNGVKG